MIRLSGRLEKIASFCSNCDILLDIGCDHALIPVSLLESGRISHAIASDINKGPVEAAKKNALKAGVSDRMTFIVDDGLKGIDPGDSLFKGKNCLLLISGMGGELIEKIISEGSDRLDIISGFVFSPQSKLEEFRRFLGRSGFHIEKEKLVREDGKDYFIIVAKKGSDACRYDMDYILGPYFFDDRDPVKRDYLEKEVRIYGKLFENEAIEKSRKDEIEKLFHLYERAVERYEMS